MKAAMIDKTAGFPAREEQGLRRPLYIHVAATLQDRIVSGHYPIASYLPPEAQLSEEFATSRNTVREALRLLAERGLVRRRQGTGTLVTSATPVVKYAQSFNKLEDLFANAKTTHYALHSIAPIVLGDSLAERVGGDAGEEWLLLTGVRWTERGGTPLAFIESYIPMEFKPIVDTFWSAPPPFYAVLEQKSGRTIDEVWQEIRAVEMPRHVANAFGLAEGSTSLQLFRRYIARGSTLIASFNWHRADQFTYQMLVHRRVQSENG
jgi:DNA-binding GntR family transcriptional regulator